MPTKLVARITRWSLVVDRDVVKNLCLLQVFEWEVKATEPETVQLFTDFCTVCYRYLLCVPDFLITKRSITSRSLSSLELVAHVRCLRPVILLHVFMFSFLHFIVCGWHVRLSYV